METNWSGSRTNPAVKKKKKELAWTHMRRSDDSIARQALDIVEPQKYRATMQRTGGKEIWRKRCRQHQVSGTAGRRWRR